MLGNRAPKGRGSRSLILEKSLGRGSNTNYYSLRDLPLQKCNWRKVLLLFRGYAKTYYIEEAVYSVCEALDKLNHEQWNHHCRSS